MKKYLALLLSLILMLSVLAACGGGGGGEESADTGDGGEGGVQVGIVLPTKDEPRWLQDEASFTTALESAGFTSEVMFSQGSTATELSNVESLVEKGVKVLVICAQDGAAAGAAVQAAKDAGVTVVCYDRLITGTDAVDYYVTFDSFAVGVAQGQYLIDAYKDKKDVPLYLFSGAKTDNNAFIFFSGAWSVLNKAVADGQFKVQNCDAIADYAGKELDAEKDHDALSAILGTIDTNWDFNTAKTLAEASLQSGQKGDVAILAPNDGTARAIADAFSADADVSSYVVTGQDAEMASLKYIQEDKQSMTVWKNTATLAKVTCDMVSEILGGGTPKTDATYNNQSKDVPSIQAEIIVVDKPKLEELIGNGDFNQADIDSAK
jgi:putative multiple sugar transport system substrate-binding protein